MLNPSHTLHFHLNGVRDKIVSLLLRSLEVFSLDNRLLCKIRSVLFKIRSERKTYCFDIRKNIVLEF